MSDFQRNALVDPEVRRSFEEELLFGEATDTVSGLVESLGITQRELANRVGVSESRISQVLSGADNLTLRSLANLGWAMGVRFELSPIPLEDRSGTPAGDDPPAPRWLRRHQSQAEPQFRHISMPLPISVKWARFGKTEKSNSSGQASSNEPVGLAAA